ncbi:MAG: hypothetical protein NVSMB17_04950 [Candidatus Dormibacteria bacterium]
MSYPIAVLTSRPGQGSTTFALSLAWDLARGRSVTLVDADMMGGTVADALELDTRGRGIANLLTSATVTGAAIEAQAVSHPERPTLHVVPGLRGFSGPSVGRLIPRLSEALRSVTTDYTVVDLGCPLAYPDLESPRVTAESISHAVRRTLVVLRDDPTFLPGSIQLLKFARIPQADLVVMKRRGSRMGRIAGDVLGVQLPGYPVWQFDWDERRGQQATYEGRILEQPGLGDALRISLMGASA